MAVHVEAVDADGLRATVLRKLLGIIKAFPALNLNVKRIRFSFKWPQLQIIDWCCGRGYAFSHGRKIKHFLFQKRVGIHQEALHRSVLADANIVPMDVFLFKCV